MNTSLQQGERVITEREVVRQDNCEAIHQISHLNPYRQVMLEERIEEIRNSK